MPTVTTHIFLPELQYWFKKYWDENSELPLTNYLQIPEIEYNEFLIRENSIFELLFSNTYGMDITGSDTTSYDVTGVDSTTYVVTNDGS